MPTVAEYTYEKEHLTETEALERYKRLKAFDPAALVLLRDLDCGHWQVDVYESETEKRMLVERRLLEWVDQFISIFRGGHESGKSPR